MYQLISTSLCRQAKGLEYLHDLLDEEFRIICGRDMQAVAACEFSIQELIRQLVVEKEFVMERLSGIRVRQYAQQLDDNQRQTIETWAEKIDKEEQVCARKATRNSELSLALLDQNEQSLQTLFKEAVPEETFVYGRRGAMRPVAAQGSLIHGRL